MNINGIGNNRMLKNTSKSKEDKNTSVDFANQLECQMGTDNMSEVSTSVLTGSISVTVAITKITARNISYNGSDAVKANVLEGYTLKAKVDIKSNTVYIEQKNEDSTVNGYNINLAKVNNDTDNSIELFALEAWGKKKDKGSTSVSDEVSQCGYSVKDKIKNDDNKFRIDGTAMMLKEWDKLISKVYKNLDVVRKNQKKRAVGQKELENKTKEANEVTSEMIKSLMVDRNAE